MKRYASELLPLLPKLLLIIKLQFWADVVRVLIAIYKEGIQKYLEQPETFWKTLNEFGNKMRKLETRVDIRKQVATGQRRDLSKLQQKTSAQNSYSTSRVERNMVHDEN